jgi:DNA repair protein RadD
MIWGLSLDGNGVICLPTGSGKSHVISGFVERVQKPILILVPSKELLQQDMDKLNKVVPKEEIGVYSASMNSKEVKKYTLATIQSAHKHPEQFAHYEIVLIDECHMVNPKSLDGMYNKFFRAIGSPKVIGLTATPFRMDVFYKKWGSQKWQVEAVTTIKMITRYRERFWKNMLYVLNTKDLMDQGYLQPLQYIDQTLIGHEYIPTNKSKSEFDLEKYDAMVSSRYGEIANMIKMIPTKSMIVYCSTIKQAEALQSLVKESLVVTSTTRAKDRELAVKRLREGKLRVLFNVGIYTVGFDYPELETILILRPTKSLNLHCQMMGRLTRKAESKTRAVVIDLAGNVKSLGKLEDIKIEKVNNAMGQSNWNVTSQSYPSGFHHAELFTYRLRRG